MPDACFLGDTLGLLEGGDRGRLQIAHLVTGEETAEVQRGFAEAVVLQPLAHPADHLHIIVHPRNDEVRQFDPHACIAHGEDGLKHGLEMAATYLLVDVVAE